MIDMKKIVMPLLSLVLLVACNSGGSKDEKKEDKKEATTDASQDPDYQKGLGLIAKNDCLTCHKIEETLTGPAYREVANKYAGTSDTVVNYLAGKIISGGSGVWGSVYMTPHPGITKEDAEAMAKYILLLKK